MPGARRPVRADSQAREASPLLVAATLLLLQAPLDAASLRHADGRIPPALTTVRVSRPPTVDGRLDDPAWREAVPARDFVETDPEEGGAPAESTTVWIVYDDAAIYVGARLYDDHPDRISRQLGRRDDHTQSDMFYVDFDTFHDHRTAFEFAANPAGVKQDDICSNDYYIGDRSWDAVWQVATAIDSLGWVVEMRIPFSQLRFPRAKDQVWGLNLFREVFRTSERSQWAYQRKNEAGYSSHFGHLFGLHDIPAPRRLEALPYTVARGTYDTPPAPNDPFDSGHTYFSGAGIDLKYGVTSNLTLDASVNPDFGQVESDPAFVNLTAFEQFLPEQRPFFVEGADIFTFGGTGPYVNFGGTPQYFYSRRVGRPPEVSPTVPSGGFADVPPSTTILGAGKLTGRTAAGWSLGVLDAVTAGEHATVADSDGLRSTQEVEPLSNYFVARLKRESGGHTGIGILATAVSRHIDAPALADLRGAAYVGAVDFFHRWSNSAYALRGSFGVSRVSGDTLAMQETQLESSRYFQRPDASYLHYDPHRRALGGVSGDLSVTKEGGNTNWAIALSTTTPGFEVNDVGFQTRVDRISGAAYLGRRWTTPGKVFRQANVDATVGPSWNYGGDRIQLAVGADASAELLNYWGGSLSVYHLAWAVDDRLTRGGPLALAPAGWTTAAGFYSDQRKLVNAGASLVYTRDVAGGWSTAVSAGAGLHPSGAVLIQLTPGYSVGRTAAQFVGGFADTAATGTYGARYVFAELLQHQVSVTVRANVTFTPTLSFQLYAEPFAFAGDYGGFKQLRAPRSFAFDVYGRDNGSSILYDGASGLYTVHPDGSLPQDSLQFANPDVQVRSLRSNAVLRWEYRPGSTLFVVWTQARSASLPDAAFDVGRYFTRDILRDRPTNVLLVKLNYWVSL